MNLQRFTDPEAAARDLVQRLARGQFRPAGAWIGSPMGEGDAAWAPIMADLLDQARRAVEQGEARSATRIYALLLPALLLDGAFGGCEDPRALLGEPVATHLLRYLQAISAQHRPAQAGHALFGQMVYRDEDDDGRVRRFAALPDAVAAYALNLNTHRAYGEFRRARAAARGDGKPHDGHALAQHLQRYSERRMDYVRDVRAVMRANGLRALDKARLDGDPS